jgi:hypothetical protein
MNWSVAFHFFNWPAAQLSWHVFVCSMILISATPVQCIIFEKFLICSYSIGITILCECICLTFQFYALGIDSSFQTYEP